MELRGIEFGHVFGASGVQGFFGEGYQHHSLLHMVPGFSFDGMTFVAKTTTLEPRAGNMPLARDGYSQGSMFPDCIVVKFWKGAMLNAVGLSGPGARSLFACGRWQERTEPFMLSFMSVEETAEQRIRELELFVAILNHHIKHGRLRVPVALQMNFSCPNVGLDPSELVDEVELALSIASRLEIPLVPKFNLMIDPKVAARISYNSACDAICCSNTVPFGELGHEISWVSLFNTSDPDLSPLAEYGGGGLSGAPIFGSLVRWVADARKAHLNKPIMAGGGIMSAEDVLVLKNVGASSVFIGSVVNLRPWRVQSIIKTANKVFGG